MFEARRSQSRIYTALGEDTLFSFLAIYGYYLSIYYPKHKIPRCIVIERYAPTSVVIGLELKRACD